MGQLPPRGGQTTAAGRSVARRSTPVWPVILVALAALAALSLAVMIPLSVVSRQPGDGLVALMIGVPYACVGVVVARRQPRNPLGWLFLAIAVCLFLSTIGGDYAVLAYRLGRHLPFAAVGLALDQLWSDGLVLFVLAILLFPDGRLPPGFWRWALRAYCAVYGILFAAFAVATAQALAARPIGVDATGGLSAIDNPAGWFAVVQRSGFLLLIAMALTFIGRQVLNWRRSSGDRRQQLKWLASGAAASIASTVLAAAFSTSGNPTTALEWLSSLAWFGVAALPISMGVAILKYRLYDIDRIISRTLAYTAVTGLLVGVYAGLVLLATHVLAFGTPVSVAAATLAAAALFSPLRRRVQRIVDRRFNRARYDAEVTVAAFAARLKDAVDLDPVRADLAGVVQQTLEPAHVSVWLSERG